MEPGPKPFRPTPTARPASPPTAVLYDYHPLTGAVRRASPAPAPVSSSGGYDDALAACEARANRRGDYRQAPPPSLLQARAAARLTGGAGFRTRAVEAIDAEYTREVAAACEVYDAGAPRLWAPRPAALAEGGGK